MNKPTTISFFLCCFLIAATSFWYPRWEKTETNATISWDIMGYYLYLPAIFIYHDVKELKFKDDIMEKYKPSGSFYQAYEHPTGNQVMKYPLGLAICYLPFFLLAHFLAGISGYPADGFSLPYQLAVHWGSVLWALWGLWMCRKLLLLYFPDKIVAYVLFLLVAGTHVLLYSGIDVPHAHIFGFGLFAYLVLLTEKWYQKPTLSTSILIGAAIGLAALIRPTDIICAMIPVVWGLDSFKSLKDRLLVWFRQIPKLLIAVLTVAIVGSLQMFYWKYATGEWIVYSYKDQGFNFWEPHLSDCLFSYKKGWLMYTPLMILSLLGFIRLFQTKKRLFAGVLLLFLIHAWITFSWDIWWYGGGVGQRAMIQIYPMLAIPMAALIGWVLERKFLKYLFWTFSLFCIWFNGMVLWQSHAPNGGFDTEYMNRAYFWQIFGKTYVPDEWTILLDNNESFIKNKKNIRTAYTNDFENELDTASINDKYAHSGTKATFINQEIPFSNTLVIPLPEKQPRGVHLSAFFYTGIKQWDTWRMPQFTITFENEGTIVKQKMIRVSRFLGENEWKEYGFDTKIPPKPYDKIKIHLWNADSDKPLWMDDLKVAYFD